MKNFLAHIQEATELKNTHITHLEDLALDGPAGVSFAISVLKEFGTFLMTGDQSHVMHTSVKWDGSPAIVFGPDPAGKGFFVATKSAFNKTPKLCHSHDEIDQQYPGPVGAILHVAFDHVLQLQPALVLQGDVLFTRESLREEIVNNVPCYTFRPNTISYRIPTTSPLASRLRQASIGLALHTCYVGTGHYLSTYSARPLTPEQFATVRQTPDVFLVDGTTTVFNTETRFTEDEESDFTVALDKALSVAVDHHTTGALTTDPLRKYLTLFLNYVVREGLTLNAVEYVEEFFHFLAGQRDKERAARTTSAGKLRVKERFQDLTVLMTEHRQGLEQWFRMYLAIARAKTVVLKALERSESDFQMAIPTPNGLQPTGHEGFVVTVGTQTVKLIDRQVFSRLNFAR